MIVLDTHVWIWLVASPDQLSDVARNAIDENHTDRQLKVSAVSVWELKLLIKRGRLTLTVPGDAVVTRTIEDPAFEFVPIDADIASRSVDLPDVHADPADRFILATAATYGCPIVSKDARFPEYGLIPIIW